MLHLKDQYNDDNIHYENDNENETADTFVEMIDDEEDNILDGNIIKYRSSSQKLT